MTKFLLINVTVMYDNTGISFGYMKVYNAISYVIYVKYIGSCRFTFVLI